MFSKTVTKIKLFNIIRKNLTFFSYGGTLENYSLSNFQRYNRESLTPCSLSSSKNLHFISGTLYLWISISPKASTPSNYYSTLYLSNFGFSEGFHIYMTYGVRNGKPLQYSYLEYSMDRGAWQNTICGITKNQTQLRLSMHAHMTQ